ncbi:hypothetical protein HUJ04_011776 [Dendroctonus ponderosae]|uniref:DUF4485 domain-containing protein n=2 Tax=Dendroctonus ponderosae TaxID=77166 RepID=A0AAR5NZS7_DENPD|nr:hypothetical protein HUJ04_011776 [Dendroctonus ponderosae]
MIQLWFNKLEHMDKTMEQMVIRSDYMWFILLMLQSRRIREPFNQLPPRHVVPLRKFVPLNVYEEVLILNEPHMIYVKRKSLDDILKVKKKRTATTSCSSLDQFD